MADNWPPRFTMKAMTPEEAGQFLANIAQVTKANSKDWDNFAAICAGMLEDAYKGGQHASPTDTPEKP